MKTLSNKAFNKFLATDDSIDGIFDFVYKD